MRYHENLYDNTNSPNGPLGPIDVGGVGGLDVSSSDDLTLYLAAQGAAGPALATITILSDWGVVIRTITTGLGIGGSLIYAFGPAGFATSPAGTINSGYVPRRIRVQLTAGVASTVTLAIHQGLNRNTP